MNRIASPPTVLREIPGPDVCDMCGAPGLRTELIRDPFIYGSGSNAVEIVADVPVHSCVHCEMSFTGEEAEIARHRAICEHLGLLTCDEIRAIRDDHGLSRAAFARLTGFGEASLARWERREVVQTASSDRYLRLLRHPEVMRRLKRLVGEESTSQDQVARAAFGRPSRQSIAEKTKALQAHQRDRLRNEATGFSPTPGHAA